MLLQELDDACAWIRACIVEVNLGAAQSEQHQVVRSGLGLGERLFDGLVEVFVPMRPATATWPSRVTVPTTRACVRRNGTMM